MAENYRHHSPRYCACRTRRRHSKKLPPPPGSQPEGQAAAARGPEAADRPSPRGSAKGDPGQRVSKQNIEQKLSATCPQWKYEKSLRCLMPVGIPRRESQTHPSPPQSHTAEILAGGHVHTFPGIFVSVQLLSHVQLFAIPWIATRQASLSFTIFQSLLKITSIESVMPFNRLILCHPILFPPSIFPSIRIFSNESVLHIRWPKY